VIATWSGGQITRAEVVPVLDRRYGPDRTANAEARAAGLKRILARRVRNQMLYREAVAEGIPERPEVKAVLQAVEEKVLAEDWLKRHVAQGVQAGASQVEQEVQRVAGQARGQELRRFSNIFLRAPDSDPQARARARARMDDIRRELADGAAFEELARKHSDSITARAGGQVEWTPRAPLHDAVAEAVFALSEGQVSEPVETEMGVHLFRLDGIRRPAPPDLKLVREDVKHRLDAEAIEAAIAAERDRAFDASGVVLDAQALARPGARDQVVAAIAGEPLRRQEFDWLREWLPEPQAQHPPVEFARWLVVNRVLSQRRRAETVDADVQKEIDEARFSAVVDARWRELAPSIPRDVSAKELADAYQKYRDTTPALRDHILDVLFFPQKGPAAAEVYAKGEAVSTELRKGDTFDQVLDRRAREPGVVVRRALPAGDVPSLRAQSLRLGGTIARLGVGEVSPPVYMEGETVTFRGKTPVLSGKGLAFVRLVEVRAQPFEAVQARLRQAIERQKKVEALAAIQKRFEDQAGLKILVSNP
jgi:parvulin-like peptidyl-prolyl isomerase